MYFRKYLFNIRRRYSTTRKSNRYNVKPDPHVIQHDYIGPPDKDSNIRPFVRCVHPNETYTEKKLRLKRIEVEEWNHSFWARHNKRFYEEKQDFIQAHNLAGIQDISADKMSEFYKFFLDKNRKLHVLYNFSWYYKNFEILILALQVECANILKTLKKEAKSKCN